MAQGAPIPRALVRCAYLAHAAHASTRYARGRKDARWRLRLGTPCQYRVRTKPKAIHYDSPVLQRRPPNPYRNLPHQNPYPAQSKQIGYSSSPSPREGVKGRGSGGNKAEKKEFLYPNPSVEQGINQASSFCANQSHKALSALSKP